MFSRVYNGVLPAAVFRYYAGLIGEVDVEEIRPSLIGNHDRAPRTDRCGGRHSSRGTCLNFSLPSKLAPALAAAAPWYSSPRRKRPSTPQHSAKPPPEAGLPPGVLNVVPGGREAGAYLVRHPGLDKVAFTGSTHAGRLVAETCGGLIRPVTLELGGKSAAPSSLMTPTWNSRCMDCERWPSRQQRPNMLCQYAYSCAAVSL